MNQTYNQSMLINKTTDFRHKLDILLSAVPVCEKQKENKEGVGFNVLLQISFSLASFPIPFELLSTASLEEWCNFV
jgi:hypothetical protein